MLMKHFYVLFLFVSMVAFAAPKPINHLIESRLYQEKPQSIEIKIYPNPATGNEVTIVSKKNVTVEVYDVLGKKVKVQNITINQNKLNISELKKGIYLLKIKTDKESITKKLIRR